MRKKLFIRVSFTLMLLCNLHLSGQQGLFISELADPADDYTGRFVELFNSGTESIDFSTQTFYLSRQSNGGTSFGDVMLSGLIPPGETYVIGTSSFASHYGFLPDLETGILIGNGDDAYFLFEGGDHASGTVHDIYGVENVDGTDEPWEYTDSRAVRNIEITTPSSLWALDDWTISSANIADCDPGVHHGAGSNDIPQPGNFSLSAVNDTVDIGQIAEVCFQAGVLLNSDNIISYQFNVEYPSGSLEYKDYILESTLSESGSIEVNASQQGLISVSFMHTEPLTGMGDLLILRFNTLTTDTSMITISNTYFNNILIDNIENGFVIASENTPPSGFLTYNDTVNRYSDTLQITAIFTEPMEPAVPVAITMTGAYEQSDIEMNRITDSIYQLDFPVPNSGGLVQIGFSSGADMHFNNLTTLPDSGGSFTIIPLNPGDVDDDGQILAYDAALTLQFSVGLDPLPDIDALPWESWRDSTANVDGISGITAYDAALILQYSAGIINSFSASAKKSSQDGRVSSEIINDEIVFYSKGSLIGLNIIVEEGRKFLGKPEFLKENFMHAVNITDDIYHIGLCTEKPASDHAPLLKIPVVDNVPFKFIIFENSQSRVFNINTATGINELKEEKFRIYPNPVSEILYVESINKSIDKKGKLKLLSLTGKVLFETEISKAITEIDVSDFTGQGICILSVLNEGSHAAESYKVVLK